LAQEAHSGDAHTHIVQSLRQLHPLAVLITHGASSRQANDLRLNRARLSGSAEVLAVRHHAWRDGARRWRLDVLVDYLPRYVLAVAGGLAVVHIDVVVLIDVVRQSRAVDCACVSVDVPVRTVRLAVHALVDRAVAYVRVDVPVCVIRCAGRCVLVDVGHRPRIDIVIGVRVGGRAGVHVRIGGRAGRRVVICVCVVRRTVRRRVIDVVGRLGEHEARPSQCYKDKKPLIDHDPPLAADGLRCAGGG
jgi:hypothetical protein